jgi:hypothetical protein
MVIVCVVLGAATFFEAAEAVEAPIVATPTQQQSAAPMTDEILRNPKPNTIPIS